MNYDEALTFVEGLRGHHAAEVETFRRMMKICEAEPKARVIHIAGTNAKGSVGFYLSTILSGAGRRVVHLASPHVVEYRERIKDNGEMISKRAFADLVTRFMEKRKRIEEDRLPYYFEMATLLGLMYAAEVQADDIILEAGIGGRDDITNHILPTDLSVMTTIGYDHEKILGNSLEEITMHKAGIIKPHTPVVSFQHTPAINRIIEQTAKENKAPLTFVDRRKLKIHTDFKGTDLERSDDARVYHTDMIGRHQGENLALALAGLDALHFAPKDRINAFLDGKTLEGRLEKIAEAPLFMIDGAHNPQAIAALMEAVEGLDYERAYVIVGQMDDKQMDFEALTQKFDKIILTHIDDERARIFDDRFGDDPRYIMTDRPEEAVNKAYELADVNDLILCTGSIYLIGEVKVLVAGREE